MARTIDAPVTLEGSPREIGLAHGRLLKESVRSNVAFYKGIFRRPADEVRSLSEHFKSVVEEHFPALAEEISGIAEGADVDVLDVYAINARTELFKVYVAECTVVHLPQSGLTGKNWDWAEHSVDHLHLLRIKPEEGPEVLTFVEAGMVGKFGVNGAGVGVCLNALKVDEQLRGVPIHVLLRATLGCSSKDEVSALLERHARGTAGCITVTFDDGSGLFAEISNERRWICDIGQSRYVHTNHYLSEDLSEDRERFASSYQRLERASEILAEIKQNTVGTLADVLGDTKIGEYPLYRKFVEHPVTGSHGTVCTVIIIPALSSISLTFTNPREGRFRTFSISG